MKKFPRTLAALACTLALFATAVLPAGPAAGKTFSDVPDGFWAAEQIAQAVEQPPVTTPEPVTQPTGDTTFAMLNGENVQQMMDRINAATPAYREGYLANGQPITEENLKAAIEKIEESMPAGSPWSADEKYDYLFGQYSDKWGEVGGGGCNSFGWAVSDAIFGEDAPVVRHQNFDQLKIGDAVWVRNGIWAPDNEGTGYSGHVYFITSNQDEDGYVDTANGNVLGESGARIVNYNVRMCVKDFTPDNPCTKYSIIYSRY